MDAVDAVADLANRSSDFMTDPAGSQRRSCLVESPTHCPKNASLTAARQESSIATSCPVACHAPEISRLFGPLLQGAATRPNAKEEPSRVGAAHCAVLGRDSAYLINPCRGSFPFVIPPRLA
jgi:hypothetical protein